MSGNTSKNVDVRVFRPTLRVKIWKKTTSCMRKEKGVFSITFQNFPTLTNQFVTKLEL